MYFLNPLENKLNQNPDRNNNKFLHGTPDSNLYQLDKLYYLEILRILQILTFSFKHIHLHSHKRLKLLIQQHKLQEIVRKNKKIESHPKI